MTTTVAPYGALTTEAPMPRRPVRPKPETTTAVVAILRRELADWTYRVVGARHTWEAGDVLVCLWAADDELTVTRGQYMTWYIAPRDLRAGTVLDELTRAGVLPTTAEEAL